MNFKTIGTIAAAALLGGILLTLSFLMRQNRQDVYLNLVCLVLGAAIGWLLGIMSAPYDKTEQRQFVIYAKAVSVFVSGYVLGKADKLVAYVLSPAVVLKPASAFRVMTFIAAALITAIVTRTFRVYW